jgi:SAM-dependent methyltransferase
MTGRPWYEELYDDFANYDQESYAQGTQGQVDFIERIIGYDQSKRILDVGCGTGRRALELSRRGYPVVGIDLSPSMLEQARWKARAEQLTVESVHGVVRATSAMGGLRQRISSLARSPSNKRLPAGPRFHPHPAIAPERAFAVADQAPFRASNGSPAASIQMELYKRFFSDSRPSDRQSTRRWKAVFLQRMEFAP